MLTDLQCREAKKTGKAYKLADAHSLYLHISATGYRSWRWKYRFDGKEKLLVIGAYPTITLKAARIAREMGAMALRSGQDPSAKILSSGLGPTFETVARAWHSGQSPLWSPKHALATMRRLEADIFPGIGRRETSGLSEADVRDLVMKIQARGAIETAHKMRGHLEDIFRFAKANGWIERNPAIEIAGALRPIKKGHRPALVQTAHAREFIKAADMVAAHPLTRLASRLLALTAVRPGIVQRAEWTEFHGLDTAEPIWHVSAEKMKLVQGEKELEVFDFIVPLSAQSVAVIKAVRELSGHSLWLFPSRRDIRKPMSDSTLSALYVSMGYRGRHVPHGWRSTFSTIMNERAAVTGNHSDREVIDLMLAHRQKGVEPIYNRTAYMPRRRELAQQWADILLKDAVPASALLLGPRR